MQTKKKRLSLLLGGGLFFGLATITMSTIGHAGIFKLGADAVKYDVVFNGSNGQSTLSTKKTKTSDAKTALNNDVKVEFKNMDPVSGKVGKLNNPVNGFKAYYGNATSINGISKITVSSDASADDAVVKYGRTSACLDGSFDLSEGSIDGIYAHYFKIVANSEVTINSISIELACDNSDDGFSAVYGSDVTSQYSFIADESGYILQRNVYTSLTSIVVPDYHDGESGYLPVTKLAGKSGYTGSYGFFEGTNSTLEEVHFPETITGYGKWFFDNSNYSKLTSFTYTRDLTEVGGTSGRIVPMSSSLKTVYYNAKNFSYSGSNGFDSSKQTALEEIYVSYDVESLPNAMASSFIDGVTLYYEGTEAEWAALTATAANWNKPTTVICADTVVAEVTLSFAGATLNTLTDEKVINTIVGGIIDNPGNPVYNDGTKQFKGWFTAASGGDPVSFPYTVTGDATIYAHFEDYGPGSSIDNPIDVVLGNTYNYTTDSSAPAAYFRVTATSDTVFTAIINSADSAFNDYIYFHAYDSSKNPLSITTSKSAATDISPLGFLGYGGYGVGTPLKVRLADQDSIYIAIDGNGNASRVGSFSITFAPVVANSGDDYTTAIPYTMGTTINANPGQKSLLWYSFTPSASGSTLFSATATAWCGGTLGYFDNGNFVTLGSNSSYNVSSTKRTLQDLNAGVTYYFAISTNNNGAQLSFNINDELDPGMAKSSAIAVTVDGASVTVPYDSDFPTVYYKFVASTDGKYRLVVDDNITIYTSGSSIPLFTVTAEDDSTVTMSAGRTAHDKVVDVLAGTYYVAIKTSNSVKNFGFSVKSVNPEAIVTVYANGPVAASTSSETIDAGTAYVIADPTYASNGYTYYTGFAGWYTDSALTVPFTSGDVINADTSLYAKLTGTYQSDLFNTLESNDTEDIIDTISTNDAYQFVEDSGLIISTNGKNAGASTGQKSSYSGMAITVKKNTQLSFKYFVSSENSDKFRVYYYANGLSGSRVESLSVGGTTMSEYQSFNLIMVAGSAVRFEYYKDSSMDTGDDMVKIKDLLFATASNCTLTYNFNDGVTADYEVEVIGGSSITPIANPTRTGFRFDGWYTTDQFAEPFSFSSGITANTTIYAKWVEQVTITFYADGPYAPSTSSQSIDKGAAISLSSLNNSYYTGFEGWFTDDELTQEITNGEIVNESISVYAKHNGRFRMDVFNDIDADFPGAFSMIEGSENAYHWNYDSATGTFTSGNKGKDSTTSTIKFTLDAGAHVSFDYSISSESGWDKCTISYTVGGVTTKVVNEGSGSITGQFNQVLDAGAVITISYSKDDSGNGNTQDIVTLTNFSVAIL